MQGKHNSQGDKWLGLVMIAVAILIALMGVTTTFGRFHGSMFGDAWDHRRHAGYGGHMMGRPGSYAMGHGSITSQWMGNGFMGSGAMMSNAHVPGWFDETYDLDLSDEQNERIAAIREQSRDVQWDLSKRLREQQWQLVKLLRADSPHPADAGKQYASISDLSRQMLEQSLNARRSIEAVLTQKQLDELRKRRRAWMLN